MLALLRLGNHDSDVFFKFKQVLIDKVSFPYSTELVQHDVKNDVEKVRWRGRGRREGWRSISWVNAGVHIFLSRCQPSFGYDSTLHQQT